MSPSRQPVPGVRADVGPTAYFHYLGTTLRSSSPSNRRCPTRSPSAQQESVRIARAAGAAVKQPRPIVLDLRGRATADHTRLLEQHVELCARDALKMQQTAERLRGVLTDRETNYTVAVFAAQIALAWYQTANVASRLPRL